MLLTTALPKPHHFNPMDNASRPTPEVRIAIFRVYNGENDIVGTQVVEAWIAQNLEKQRNELLAALNPLVKDYISLYECYYKDAHTCVNDPKIIAALKAIKNST